MPIKHEPNLKGFHDIKADKDLVERTAKAIMSRNSQNSRNGNRQAKNDHTETGNRGNLNRILSLAASFVLVIGAIAVYSFDPFGLRNDRIPDRSTIDNAQVPDSDKGNQDGDNFGQQSTPNKDAAPQNGGKGSLEIPAIELPKNTKGVAMDMIGLFVYNGRIYTQTGTDIDAENGKKLLGEKLGITKGSIDEWSKQDEYAVEFASSIGEMEVYTAKGYDKDFRLMTYAVYDDGEHIQFYECLNGITINSGQDVFGKLKIEGNIVNAWYQTYEDWNTGSEEYSQIDDIELCNTFAKELNNTVPYPYDAVEMNEYRSNGSYLGLAFELKDGSIVQLALFKNGFIRYGYSNFYMKMEHEVFQRLWDRMTD